MPSPLLPLCLNLDGSIAAQPQILGACHDGLDLRREAEALRLSAARETMTLLRRRLLPWRQKYSQPWLTFIGSGDFHHLSLALLETLPDLCKPYTLVLIDNHPDWFSPPPRYHCGNWVSGALRLRGLKKLVMIGQDSHDLRGFRFANAPFRELCRGFVSLYPARRAGADVPLQWAPRAAPRELARRRLWGTRLHFQTLAALGAEAVFKRVAAELAGQNVYISIDKDCLARPWAVTDWEQGQLTLEELAAGVRELAQTCNVIGADTCGDRAPRPLSSLLKRIDAGPREHVSNREKATAPRINEKVNLALLDALGAAPASTRA